MDGRGFRFGDWQVDVGGNSLSHGDARATLEPRAMDVLRYLCRHPGAVIPAEELLQKCWGTAELGDNPVHKAIAQLRRALGDSSTEPRYIETVRKRGYRAIASVVEAADHAETWHGGSPFRGLEAFQESHAAIFFGRVQATQRLRDLVLAQVAGGCPMALVLGPSGSGKTSLVRAGLLPALADAGPVALSCVLHMDCADLGGGGLFEALAAVLLDAELADARCFEGSSADALARRLREEPQAVAAELDSQGLPRIGVFIDRLEAVFRAPATSDADRAQFVAVLEQLARAGVLVILACRNDFYPALIALPELMALKGRGGHFDVEPPGGADIAQMVRQPARAAQLAFEHDAATGASLDDVLCDAARASPDALPLLQYCLDELYRQRGDDGTLKFDVFRQLGGIEGALGVRAEQVVARLPAAQQAALPHVLSLLVNIGETQGAITARRTPWAALDSEAKREVVRALVEARLFVSELTGDVPTFGVAHEALLRRWPRVVEWIERHRQALQIRTRVATQAERWMAAGRPRDLLLPAGIQVTQATSLLALDGFSLAPHEKAYVTTSLRGAKLGERLRIAAMTIIVLLALLAIGLGLLASQTRDEAERKRADAENLMSFMLGDFVDKLKPLGRLDLLSDVSGKALSFLAAREREDDNHHEAMQRAKSLQLIAEVNIARANAAAALEALTASGDILQRQLQRFPGDPAVLKATGANAFWIGQIYYDRRDWAGSMRHMTHYRTLAERLVVADRQSVDSLLELSYAHNSLGSAALKQGELVQAAAAFSKAAELKRIVIRREPGNTARIVDLANSVSWLASTIVKRGELKKALALFHDEEMLMEGVHREHSGNAVWTQRLAFALWRQAELKQALGQVKEAREFYERAEAHLAEIGRQDPSNRSWQKSLHAVRLKRLDMSIDTDAGQVLVTAEALLPAIDELVKLDPKRHDLKQLALKARMIIAESRLRMGKPAAAQENLIPLLAAAAQVQAAAPADPSLRSVIAQLHLLDARIWKQLGNAEKAATRCRSAKALVADNRHSADYTMLVPFVEATICLGLKAEAEKQVALLRGIGYQDRKYLTSITTNQGTEK